MRNKNIFYHPKLLKIFTKEELDCLEKEGMNSIDKNGYINNMLISRDKIMVEIFTDCEAEKEETAIILLLDDRGYKYPNRLTKDEFWKVYLDSKVVKMNCIVVDS